MRRYIKSYLLSEQFISAVMAERSVPCLGLTSNNSTLWVNLKRAQRADSQMSLAAERCCRWITGGLSGSDSHRLNHVSTCDEVGQSVSRFCDFTLSSLIDFFTGCSY